MKEKNRIFNRNMPIGCLWPAQDGW